MKLKLLEIKIISLYKDKLSDENINLAVQNLVNILRKYYKKAIFVYFKIMTG
jgi:hypothetical protein